MSGTPVVRVAKALCLIALAGVLFGLPCTAKATEPNPLSPLDTSSPRATLQGFTETVDDIYAGFAGILEDYIKSGQLYLAPELRQRQMDLLRRAPKAIRAL